MTRDRGVLLVALAVVLAGCGGTLVEFTASPATIPDGALEPHGYVHGNTTEVPVTYPVGVSGVSRDVRAETWVSGYSKPTADDRAAVLVLYSSPNVRVANTSVNPLTQLSNRELVRLVLERVTDLRGVAGVDDVSDLRETAAQNVTVLGTRTRMTSYGGTGEIDGRRSGVVVNVAVVEHRGDVIVALGVHDEALDERATQAALVEQTEHGG